MDLPRFFVYMVAMTFNLAIVLRSVWVASPLTMKAALVTFRSMVGRLWKKREDKDPFFQEVDRQYEENMKDRVERKLIGFAFAASMISINAMQKMLLKKPRITTDFQDAMLILMVLWVPLSVLLVKQVRTFHNLWHVASMTFLALVIASANPQDECMFYFWNAVTTVVRISLSCGYSQTSMAVFSNVIYLFLQLFGYWSLDDPTRSLLSSSLIEVGMTGAVLLFTHFERVLVRELISNGLKIRSLNERRSAMTKLLELVCDVIVEVNEAGAFTEHFPRFATVLMMNKSKNTKDVILSQFLVENDRERLKDELQATGEDLGRPAALHVTLSDGAAIKVNMEFFFVGFCDLGGIGEKRFLIGMREDGQARDMPAQSETAAAPAPTAAATARFATNRAIAATDASRGPGRDAPLDLGQRHLDFMPEAIAIERNARAASVEASSAERRDKWFNSESSWSSSRRSSSRTEPTFEARAPMLVPNMRPTSQGAKEILLVAAALKINVKVPQWSCCDYHAAIFDLQATAGRLRRAACPQDFELPPVGAQCSSCGTLAKSTCQPCIVCGKALSEQTQGPPSERPVPDIERSEMPDLVSHVSL